MTSSEAKLVKKGEPRREVGTALLVRSRSPVTWERGLGMIQGLNGRVLGGVSSQSDTMIEVGFDFFLEHMLR